MSDWSLERNSRRKNKDQFERRMRTVGEELDEMEKTNPAVKSAKKDYDAMAARILGTGPALSYSEVRDIYGDQTWRGNSSSPV